MVETANFKPRIYEKLFVWSVVTEPLLFFTLNQAGSSISLTLSRSLQIAFLMFLLIRSIQSVRIPKIKVPNVVCFFFLFTLLVSLMGFFLGSYDFWSDRVRVHISIYARPFVEFFILIYYFLYFLILPRYVLKSREQVEYFFKWTKRVIYIVLTLGLVDFIVQILGIILSSPGLDFIPRHLVDSRWVQVGFRFHSILGEPRDAFVYLMFACTFLLLYAELKGCKTPKAIILILLSLILTQSVSGVFGVVIGIGISLFYLFKIRWISIKFMPLYLLLLILTIYLMLAYLPHMKQYYAVIFDFLYLDAHEVKNNFFLHAQSPDLIPLKLLIEDFFHYNFSSLLVGNGIGSSSFALNNFFSVNDAIIDNPRSQFVRLFFETGLIGLFLYLIIMTKPILRLKFFIKERYNVIFFSSLFLFSAVLGHRSNIGIIFVGMVSTLFSSNYFLTNEKD